MVASDIACDRTAPTANGSVEGSASGGAAAKGSGERRANYRGTVLLDELAAGARPTTERPDRMVLCFGEPALSDGGRIVWVTGNAGRLLAGLVARRRGVTIDQLIDVVWPGDPPKSARSALHVHLGRLRRELEAVAEGPTVEREGSNYRLDLNGWTVDVDLFRELRHEATTAPATTVVGLLAEALRLARSPAFVVDGESVAPSAAFQLAAARLDVEEQLVDALLDVGRYADAERAAIELVDAEPFRERRWALLMRAEAMQGRRRDALATFQRARRRLVDELGLEPGDDLQQTQRFVLSGDTTSLQSTDPLPGFEFDREPLPFGPLVGREGSVERVEQALAQRLPVVVTGAPGAGKTRLATEIARSGPVAGPGGGVGRPAQHGVPDGLVRDRDRTMEQAASGWLGGHRQRASRTSRPRSKRSVSSAGWRSTSG